MAFLTGTQSDLIREAFDALIAATGELDELKAFRFTVQYRSEVPRTTSTRSLEVRGLVSFMSFKGERRDEAFYMPTEQGIDEALRLGVISRDDVEALRKARERANLRAQGGA
jgi:hypothetical protein